MTAPALIAALAKLRAVVEATGDVELCGVLAELISAAPAAAPGARRPSTIAALQERDRLLKQAAGDFGLSAGELASVMARYAAAAWPRDRVAQTCPARHHGRVEERLWHVLKRRDDVLGERRIRSIIGNERPEFISERTCHNDA